MRIRYYLPSGFTGTIEGRLLGLRRIGNFALLAIEATEPFELEDQTLKPGEVFGLDTLTYALDELTGAELYNPREHMKFHSLRGQSWLVAHPDYPSFATLIDPPDKRGGSIVTMIDGRDAAAGRNLQVTSSTGARGMICFTCGQGSRDTKRCEFCGAKGAN